MVRRFSEPSGRHTSTRKRNAPRAAVTSESGNRTSGFQARMVCPPSCTTFVAAHSASEAKMLLRTSPVRAPCQKREMET